MRKRILLSVFALLAAQAAISAQNAASRHIDFSINMPRHDHISQVQIKFNSTAMPDLPLTFNSESGVISGRAEIPSGINVRWLKPAVYFQTDPGAVTGGVPVLWKYDLSPLDLAASANQSFSVSQSYALAEADLQAVVIEWTNNTTYQEAPTACDLKFVGEDATGRTIKLGVITQKRFTKPGSAHIWIPIPSGASSPVKKIDVAGVYSAQSRTEMNQTSIAQFSPAASSVSSVKLVFDDWLTPVRTAIERVLTATDGVGAHRATTISQVDIVRDGACVANGVRWKPGATAWESLVTYQNWIGCSRYNTPQIFVGKSDLPTSPDFGDNLTHEWIHEAAFVLGAQTGPGGRHEDYFTCGSPDNPKDENFPWDEAVSDFLGSNVLARVLDKSDTHGRLAFNLTGPATFWIDNDEDWHRSAAVHCIPDSGPNAGSYVEGVLGGALDEIYKAFGYDTDNQPEETFHRFVKDWMAFATATQSNVENRTGEEYFRELRAKATGNQQKLVDQVAVWYLIWTRQQAEQYGSIAKLIPVELHSVTKLPVSTGQNVSLKASALMFRRVAASPKAKLTVRLLENGKEISMPVAVHEDKTLAGFNYAADFAVSWPCAPGQSLQHQVQAEVRGTVVGGTLERLGLSDSFPVQLSAAAGCNQNSGSGSSAASNPPAKSGGGHWERGAPSILWPYGPPTDGKTGKKVGDQPSAGETWITGTDFDHQWSVTIESAGPSQFTYRSFALPDPKKVPRIETGNWTLPPASLTPGQTFTMQITSGAAGAGASCYAWQGEETDNEHLIWTTGPGQTVTSAPFKIPEGSQNDHFGFFCGTSILKWTYTYRWVGGTPPATP